MAEESFVLLKGETLRSAHSRSPDAKVSGYQLGFVTGLGVPGSGSPSREHPLCDEIAAWGICVVQWVYVSE